MFAICATPTNVGGSAKRDYSTQHRTLTAEQYYERILRYLSKVMSEENRY